MVVIGERDNPAFAKDSEAEVEISVKDLLHGNPPDMLTRSTIGGRTSSGKGSSLPAAGRRYILTANSESMRLLPGY